ncbi:hypothetical protein K443DRAFT_4164 [Laccaria amethystina LaAM-08-1]|uniref:Uncharacterized protein n=1 Tax=Laccaria amethystina LaAM-08-1 TaxID=1095629 RepID=A0A0C9XIX1_9AGAR|nr:hypothetical protein K443DRAFT_4164 [Laccaria amethystina LaAM-08-1]
MRSLSFSIINPSTNEDGKRDVSDITKAPEIVGGRVKMLHPAAQSADAVEEVDIGAEQRSSAPQQRTTGGSPSSPIQTFLGAWKDEEGGVEQTALTYGANPHQKPAQAYVSEGELPFKVLSESPGYINLFDALNSYALVKELQEALDLPAAAPSKEVSPGGAAVGVKLTETKKKVYGVDDPRKLWLRSPPRMLEPRSSLEPNLSGAGHMSPFCDSRQNPRVLALPFKKEVKRAEKATLGVLVRGRGASIGGGEERSKVRYLVVTSGTIMDEECVKAADEHGIVFALTSLRLFYR